MTAKRSDCRLGSHQQRHAGATWLEILLALAFLSLLFQVFPSLWKPHRYALDVRQWSSAAWMTLNITVLLALFGLRFAPSATAAQRERRKRLTSHRKLRLAVMLTSAADEDLEARRRRDAEWVKRAKKRLLWQ